MLLQLHKRGCFVSANYSVRPMMGSPIQGAFFCMCSDRIQHTVTLPLWRLRPERVPLLAKYEDASRMHASSGIQRHLSAPCTSLAFFSAGRTLADHTIGRANHSFGELSSHQLSLDTHMHRLFKGAGKQTTASPFASGLREINSEVGPLNAHPRGPAVQTAIATSDQLLRPAKPITFHQRRIAAILQRALSASIGKQLTGIKCPLCAS